jgi:hypothetical protein
VSGLAVVSDREDELAVGGGEGFVGGDAGMCVAHPGSDHARRGVGACLVGEPSQQRGEQVHLDALTLARPVAVTIYVRPR